MRILLANHTPFHGSGAKVEALARSLASAGHQVRCLIVDDRARSDDAVPVRRVVSRAGDAAADLPFDFPSFDEHPLSSQTFQQLTDKQLACYRDVLRQAMDAEVAGFDPDVIHAQDIWVMGHLALEAGAPYVLTTSGREFAACRLDPRFRCWVEETAENAGRILAADEATRREVIRLFGDLDGRILTQPNDDRASAAGAAEWLGGVYRDVRQERFGTLPEG
jgi:hypothetical protein